MSKNGRRNRADKAEKLQRKKPSKFWKTGFLVIGIGLVAGVFLFLPKGEPWGLPAIPSNPRPATLSPDLFSGKVAETYRIAQEAPELLERMPCYCGCYVTAGHRNNLDCYTDRHAVG
jgi:hypothetical protein